MAALRKGGHMRVMGADGRRTPRTRSADAGGAGVGGTGPGGLAGLGGLGGAARRRIAGRPVLPSGRALVGGLLLAVSGVVTFAAWQQASGVPDHAYVVAERSLAPGERLTADDLATVRLDLPRRVAGGAFGDVGALVDRVTLGPVGAGELVQATQVSDAASAEPLVEVSFALPRDRALDGRLRSGDRVDVFVTYDDYTAAVVDGAEVVTVGDAGGSALGPASEVTVTLALEAASRRAQLVHAVRVGEVTLVRSTQAVERAPATGVVRTPSSPPAADTPGDVFRPEAPAPSGPVGESGGSGGSSGSGGGG
jgi:Flp pilus assembly protein CpaB